MIVSRRTKGRLGYLFAGMVAAGWPAAPATAQMSCAPPPVSSSTTWAAPFDRLVSVQIPAAPLREALERVATESGVRLTYSAESVEGLNASCLAVEQQPLGSLLDHLLAEAPIEVVIAALDHLVLAPVASSADEEAVAPATVIPLAPVIVTAKPGDPDPHVPFALKVVTPQSISARSTTDVPSLLAGAVPGLWAWSTSPADLRVSYGSVRGSSSFTATYPKIYIDGIEVADPHSIAQLTSDAIERVEVIRGPQGAALYGADAISGVVNIFTRPDLGGPTGPRFQLRSGGGMVASDYASASVLSQEHVFSGRVGDTNRSLRYTLAGGSTGAFVSGGDSRYFAANTSGRVLQPDRIITGIARINFVRTGPVSASFGAPLGVDLPHTGGNLAEEETASRRSSFQYTLGTTFNFMPSTDWAHRLTIGVDGYRLSGLASAASQSLPVTPQSGNGADRLSVRAVSEWDVLAANPLDLTLSFGAEQSLLRRSNETETANPPADLWARAGQVTASYGLLGHVSASLADRLFVSGGLRLEAYDGMAPGKEYAQLPSLGAAYIHDRGPVSAKLRAAYGKGIRPAQAALADRLGMGTTAQPDVWGMPPEEQSGTEFGVDFVLAERFSLGVTRFDQVASNLIQLVPTSVDGAASPSLVDTESYHVDSGGSIANSGWEAEGSAVLGRLSMNATFAAVDSRVRAISDGYAGDLRVGDQMLAVPGRTAGLSATWTDRRWSLGLDLFRAWNWVNYDRERMLSDLARDVVEPEELIGERLRGYWQPYDGIPRLDLSGTYEIFRGTSLVLLLENVFDRQLGEPDNATVVPGRSVGLSVRARL